MKFLEIKWLGGGRPWKHLKTVKRTSLEGKGFSQRSMGYNATLTWTAEVEEELSEAPEMQSASKVATNQKRDIVDTLFHASRVFGHYPVPRLAFTHIWGKMGGGSAGGHAQ